MGWTALVTLALLLGAIPWIVGREGWLRKFAVRLGERASGSERLHGLIKQGSEIPQIVGRLLVETRRTQSSAGQHQGHRGQARVRSTHRCDLLDRASDRMG